MFGTGDIVRWNSPISGTFIDGVVIGVLPDQWYVVEWDEETHPHIHESQLSLVTEDYDV